MNIIIFKSAQSRCIYAWKEGKVILIDNSGSPFSMWEWAKPGVYRTTIGFKDVNFIELIEKKRQDFVVSLPMLKSSHLYYILAIL